MRNRLLASLVTGDDTPPLVLRTILGVVIGAHGAQKLFGWFGGHGPAQTIASFEEWFGFPAPVTVLVILAETACALGLIVGFATRFAALAVGLVMAGAIGFVVGKWGFFMNWYSQPRGEGYEYHVLVLAMVAATMITGGGRWSVDRWLSRRVRATDGS